MPPKKVSLPPNPPPDLSQHLPLSYTNFFSVAPINAKNVSSSYLKTEAQTWMARSQAASPIKKRKVDESDEEGEDQGTGPAVRTLVIHPGSEFIRIGRATDLYPLTVPNAIARRPKLGAAVAANGTVKKPATNAEEAMDEDDSSSGGGGGQSKMDVLDQGIETIRNDLRAIMRQEKLRPVGNGKTLAANYNDGIQPEDVPEHNDMFGLDWTDEDRGGKNDVLVGEKALRLACFSQAKTAEPKQKRQMDKVLSDPDPERPWKLFRPFQRGTLDLNSYQEHYGPSAAVQALLGDVRTIFENAITSPPEDPDRQEMTQVVATGLGIPSDQFPSHSIVLIVPDLYSRSDLKALSELILQDMGFAALCIQSSSVCATFGAGLSSACVVDLGSSSISISCVEEGLILPETRLSLSYGGYDLSQFLGQLLLRSKFPYRQIDFQHNLADKVLLDGLKEKMVTLNPADVGLNIHDFYLRLPRRPTKKYLFRTYDELIMGPMSLFDPRVFGMEEKRMLKGRYRVGDEKGQDEAVPEEAPELSVAYGQDTAVTLAMQNCVKHLLPPPPTAVVSEVTTLAPAPVESAVASRAPSPSLEASAQASPAPTCLAPPPTPVPTFDVILVSSQTPLDRAIYNSLLSSNTSQTGSAGEERFKKMANNILCVGGTALIPGLASALEARLNALFDGENAPKITVIPPPRDMDPRLLAWKGMAVYARLETSNELWVRKQDWDLLGYRALKEKTLFL